MDLKTMDLKTMQSELPEWHVDEFGHAVTHGLKALGKLAGMVDDIDHAVKTCRVRGTDTERIVEFDACPSSDLVARYAADLVVCALKMAQTCPSGVFDLEAAVVSRVREKNTPGAFPSARADEP